MQLSLAQWAWMPVLQAQAGRHAHQSEEAALLMQGRAMSRAGRSARHGGLIMQAHEHWIAWPLALLAAPGREEPEGKEAVPVTAAESACWWALEFSPRVAVLEEALLMETSMVQRLWGGLQPMLEQLDRAFAQACLASQVGMPDAALGKSMVRAEADTPWLALAG